MDRLLNKTAGGCRGSRLLSVVTHPKLVTGIRGQKIICSAVRMHAMLPLLFAPLGKSRLGGIDGQPMSEKN
jgi:hypothetical protein